MLQNNLLADESWTDLCTPQGYAVLQKNNGFRFSIDAVLLSHFLNWKPHSRMADLGTGSGVIPLLCLAQEPTLDIHGFELQSDIADMARRTIALQNIAQIQIYEADFTMLDASHNGKYDYVVSNPPYFPKGTGKQNPNPQIALARHELACTLEQLVAQAGKMLKNAGIFVMIHRAERLPETLSLCEKYHLAPKTLRMVHSTIEKPANVFLLEALRNGRNELTVAAPLVVCDMFGNYTKEVSEYYKTDSD